MLPLGGGLAETAADSDSMRPLAKQAHCALFLLSSTMILHVAARPSGRQGLSRRCGFLGATEKKLASLRSCQIVRNLLRFLRQVSGDTRHNISTPITRHQMGDRVGLALSGPNAAKLSPLRPCPLAHGSVGYCLFIWMPGTLSAETPPRHAPAAAGFAAAAPANRASCTAVTGLMSCRVKLVSPGSPA